ncbi:MAG: hypothetical protein ACE5GC_06215 [Acidimicrobiia bacterium]
MVERRDLPTIAATLVLGAVAGAALGATVGALVGGLTGALFGFAASATGVRPLVTLIVGSGTLVGFVLGRGVVRVLCAPSGCPATEWTAGAATGVGALIGVGLVVALATRSFDEYREAVAANRPPPEPGCESDEGSAEPE